ncbi:MAG: hypothetical protein RLZZ628_3807 [Bacteroidota bacterium]|jgi:hypothetical protein
MLKKQLLFCIILCSNWLRAQSGVVIQGIVQAQNGLEPLIGAIIYDSLHQKITLTNEYGHFALPTAAGWKQLKITYLGYEPFSLSFQAESDTFLKCSLREANEFKMVEIKSNHFEKVTGGRQELPIAQLNTVPSIGGEKDLIKALTILPGIAAGEEGSASILVRGGSSDQNLFIIDGAQVYNTGHLFGFVSLFNADAIKKVDLYKNAFPARYGGRLSSILDVHCKEGSKERIQGKFDLGLINSKMSLEGPIGQKSTFSAAVRTAYLDLFSLGKEKKVLTPGIRDFGANQSFMGYTFADANFKIAHAWNEQNKIFINFYLGKDLYRSATAHGQIGENNNTTHYILTNLTASSRAYHRLHKNVFAQWYTAYSQNRHQFNTLTKEYQVTETAPPAGTWLPPSYQFKLAIESDYSSVGSSQNVSAGARVDLTPYQQAVTRIGIDAIHHFYAPNQYRFQVQGWLDSTLNSSLYSPTERLQATELGVYCEQEIQLSKSVEAHIGLRLSHFRALSRHYTNLEPRYWMNYMLPHTSGVLSFSVAKMQQYQHALIKGGELVDRVVWVPSGALARLVPQSAWQYAIGWRKSLKPIDISVELFYKKLHNMSWFSPEIRGLNPYNDWQNRIFTEGQGWSYGLEWLALRKVGRLQGSFAYTWSRSDRQFAHLNNGQPFPFLYDRRHNATLTARYELSSRLKINALWVLANGKRYNLPVARVGDSPFQEAYAVYGSINSGQYPLYHRLDLSLNWECSLSKHRFWGWSANLYNAYFRKNVYYMYITQKYEYDNQGQMAVQKEVMRQVSLFPILPSFNIFYAF